MSHQTNWRTTYRFLLAALLYTFTFSGCISIIADAPLLTPNNSERIANLDGYYYIFPSNSDSPEPQYFQIILEKENGASTNLYSVNPGPLSVLEEKDRSFIRFKQLEDQWLLGQAWDKSSENNPRKRDLFFMKRQGKGAVIFIHSDGYSLPKSVPPSLSGHISKQERDLRLDKVAVTTFKEETLQFLAKEFANSEVNLKAISEVGPTDKRTAYSSWCEQATDDLYERNYFEKDKLQKKTHYAVHTCDQAVELNPYSPTLKKNYGRALHKAGRYPEALEWLNK